MNECFVHQISTFCAQRDALMYTKLKWLFYQIFLFTLRAQPDAPTYTKLKWLFHRIFCSHSPHSLMLQRIQNLNGFSIGFFCSHSAHSLTLRRIQRLSTSVGLAQARPKYQAIAKTNYNSAMACKGRRMNFNLKGTLPVPSPTGAGEFLAARLHAVNIEAYFKHSTIAETV